MLEVEKTHFLTMNDKTIPVSQLPQQIKEQVELFDAMRQDALDKTYELNIYQLAVEHKKAQLQQLMQQYSDAQAEQERNKSNVESDGEPGTVDLNPPKQQSKKKTSKKKTSSSKDED